MVTVYLCGHSLLFSCSNQNFQSVQPHSFQIDWIVFCHCCHICSDCYICSVRSCGNWLLTAKDLLTLKSVASCCVQPILSDNYSSCASIILPTLFYFHPPSYKNLNLLCCGVAFEPAQCKHRAVWCAVCIMLLHSLLRENHYLNQEEIQ